MVIPEILSQSDRPIDVICFGRVAVDLYAEQIGSTLEDAQTFRKYLGGCAGNIAVGTARLGLKSAMCSRVGSDAMGKFVRAKLDEEGVDTSHLATDSAHLTGLVLLGVKPPNEFPLIFYRNQCADEQMLKTDAPHEFLRKSKCLLVTGTSLAKIPIRETLQAVIHSAQHCETAVMLDIDYRPVLWGLAQPGDGETRYQKSSNVSDIFATIIPFVSLIVGTEEEFLIASGQDTVDDAVRHFRKTCKAVLVLKKGERGCDIWTPEKESAISSPALPVKVLNVLGAGDAFMSGFLRGLLRGESFEVCAQYANACGALVVTRHGCSPAMPSMDELNYVLSNPQTINAPAEKSQLQKLHRALGSGTNPQSDLLILAFDHRVQFEASCKTHSKPFSLIADFKGQVFKGFLAAQTQLCEYDTAILVDPVYGQNVLHRCEDAVSGQPIEAAAADSNHLEWLNEQSVYQELLQRPSQQMVKVLVRFHPSLPAIVAAHQIAKLRELVLACDALERRLILELLMPDGVPETGESHAEAMRALYEKEIAPWRWKIQAMHSLQEWQQVTSVIDIYDTKARVVILGKGASIDELSKGFAIAKSSAHACGFAVGRTIFWPSWEKIVCDKIALTDVSSDIAARFLNVARAWKEAGVSHEQ